MSETFLSRWARRKEAVRAERTVAPPAASEAGGADAPNDPSLASAAARPQAGTEIEPSPLPELPSLEDLTAQSDLTAFLRAGIPTPLRNAALRRMWSLDPSIRDFVSEAREYAYDWNTPGGVPGLGPLLPTDNVKAMLDRVIGGVPAKSETPETGEDAPDEGADAPGEDPPGVTVAAPAEATASAELGESTLALETRAVETGSPAVELVSNPASEGAVAGPDRPRLRRHGGAMPV